MGANIRQLIRLWGIHAKLDLLWFTRDTKYCVYNIIADVISSLSSVAAVFLLAKRFGSIGGMQEGQVLFMLGYACLVDGTIQMFFSMNNVAWISRIIGRGQLDHRLIQPVPLWMQLLTEGFIPISGSSVMLSGAGIIILSLQQMAVALSPLFLGGLVFSLAASIAVILAFSYIAGCVAFYAPVAGEEISTSAIGLFGSLKTFPLGGLATGAQIFLCTILPVGLAAWYPANVLLGQSPANLGSYILPVAAVLLSLVASRMFKKGLKHYAKSGSIRYSDRGHRR